MIRQYFSLKLRTDRRQLKSQRVFNLRNLGRLHTVNGLIQAIDGCGPRALRVLGKMQYKVQLRFADLQCAGPFA